MKKVPIISFVGRSGSGKTTLLEKLIPELNRRGYRVAVIKHHPDPGLETDSEGKDTWRMACAGADQVILAAPDQIVHWKFTQRENSLREIAATLQDVNLILTEGYKREDAPKIEISRGKESLPLLSLPEELVAAVSDRQLDLPIPLFGLDDVVGLADLIETEFPLD